MEFRRCWRLPLMCCHIVTSLNKYYAERKSVHIEHSRLLSTNSSTERRVSGSLLGSRQSCQDIKIIFVSDLWTADFPLQTAE